MTNSNSDKSWKVDKHIPLALIFVIACQTVGALWWASKVEFGVQNNAKEIKKLQEAAKGDRILYERIVRLEVLVERVLEEVKSPR